MLPDEVIARKIQKRRQKEEANVKAEKQEISEKELIAAVKEGKAVIEEKIILFQRRGIFENRLFLYLPGTQIKIQEGNRLLFQMADFTEAISIQLALEESRKEPYSYQEYKEMLKQKMESPQMILKWREEGVMTCESGIMIRYIDFLVQTGLATVHNKFLFFSTSFGLVTGNLNYDEKEKKIYTPVMNVITRLIEVEG